MRCSAKGCQLGAEYLVVWNNPKVHTPDREKTWAACATHRQSLADYLDLRSFLIRVDPLVAAPESAPSVETGTAPYVCPGCGARFPAEQVFCPVCANLSPGSCGGRD